MNSVNGRIKQLRLKHGLSQALFGNAIGLSKSGISNIENGRRTVSDRHIMLIAAAFNVNVGWLKYGVDEATLAKSNIHLEALEVYLQSIGYSVTLEKVGESESGDYEEQILNGEVVDRFWVPDEEYFNYIIRKAGVETEFTKEELKAFQAEIEQSIEYQLWKKNQSR